MKSFKPVTEERLIKLFGSPRFCQKIGDLTALLREAEAESIFCITQGRGLKFYCPENDCGVSDPYRSSPSVDRFVSSSPGYLLTWVHSHPGGSVRPSSADWRHYLHLKQTEEHKKIDNLHLMGVVAIQDTQVHATYIKSQIVPAKVDYSHEIDLLLVQSTAHRQHHFLIEDAYDKVELLMGQRFFNNEEVAEAYDSLPFFRAALLRYHVDSFMGRETCTIAKEELEKVRKFAYLPMRIK